MTPTQLFIFSVLQWGLFIGLGFQIFGWSEKKPKLTIIAFAMYLMAALFAGYTLYTGELNVEIARERQLVAMSKIILGMGSVSIVALLLMLKKKSNRFLNGLIAALALVVFLILTQDPKVSKEKQATPTEQSDKQ
ncbi:hypothetical protein EMN47_00660 [Prolixibacteraceae bacterium JC049]|nr:hypothetical protein [Prolixibacteraceae bacterium JC049]